MTESIRIDVKDVRVSFGGVHALRGVSVGCEGPAIVGVVGPNGSGKSTLMGVMSGLVRPSSGAVALEGHELAGKSALKFARRGLRRSFQTTKLIPTLTIRDNLLIGVGRISDEVRERAQSLAEQFGFAADLHRFPSAVPIGRQRLVQVAAVVMTDPRVVLLDEPAAGLTDAECAVLIDIVRACAKNSLVVLVEHNMQLIYELADRVIVLINGEVAVDGPVPMVRENPAFRAAYLGLQATAGAMS